MERNLPKGIRLVSSRALHDNNCKEQNYKGTISPTGKNSTVETEIWAIADGKLYNNSLLVLTLKSMNNCD